jgi:hypothetical protein
MSGAKERYQELKRENKDIFDEDEKIKNSEEYKVFCSNINPRDREFEWKTVTENSENLSGEIFINDVEGKN